MDPSEAANNTNCDFFELAHLFVRFLPLRDIKSLLTVSRNVLQTFQNETVLEAWIMHAYSPTCLGAPGPRTALIPRLFNNEIGSKQLYIVHMDGNYWNTTRSNGLSKYDSIAQLRCVCWLEVSGTFVDVLPGRYKVIWRLEMPTNSSTNFSCDWTANVLDSNAQACGVSSSFKHGKSPSWSAQLVGKGWFTLTAGEIEIPAGCFNNTVRVQMLGGNSTWFRDLRLDYVALRPAPIEDHTIHPLPIAEIRLHRQPTLRILCDQDTDEFNKGT